MKEEKENILKNISSHFREQIKKLDHILQNHDARLVYPKYKEWISNNCTGI